MCKRVTSLSLRISHLEPEKRRVGFTQRWGTELDGDEDAPAANCRAQDARVSAADARLPRTKHAQQADAADESKCLSLRSGPDDDIKDDLKSDR